MKKILLSTLLVCLLSSVWGQCMLYPVSLDERIHQSAVIMEGRVVSSNSYWDATRGNIYTLHQIEASKLFKWQFTGGTYQRFYVVTEGGRVGDMMQKVTSSLELEVGDVGIFFGINAKAQFNNAEIPLPLFRFEGYAGPQGFITFDENGVNATDPFHHYIVNPELYNRIIDITGQKPVVIEEFINEELPVTAAAPVVNSFGPDSASAGTKTKLTINGSNFGTTRGTSYVGFKNGDDGGGTVIKPYDVEYISWSDTKIEVLVTAKAGTGKIEVNNGSGITQSATSLVVTFAQLNVRDGNDIVYQPRHIGRNGNGYVWQFYTGFEANSAAKQSFLRAFQNWRCGTLINWDMGSTTTKNVIALDSVNIVRFDIGNELPSGVLGRCSSWWSGCGNGGGSFDWFVNELDIVFDDGTNWHYTTGNPISSKYDFESVAVHELGHGHQLGHVINSSEIMHYSIANGQTKRTLSTKGDLKGGNYVMTNNLLGAFCGKTIMKALTPGSCSLIPVAGFMASDTTLCPSKVMTFTDTSTGSTNTYAWNFGFGAIPPTATGKGPHLVNYSTSGKKAVQLIVGGVIGNDTSTRIDYINVLPGKPTKPLSIFGKDTGCIAAQVFTTNKVTDATSYVWGVNGSGTTNSSVDSFSTITFSAPGNVGIWVKAGNSCGVSDSVVKPVVVISKPIAAFAFSIRKDTIDIANGSTGAFAFTWKFGNNQTAASQNLLLIPTQSGTYSITLVATNSCGSDSVTKAVTFVMPTVGEGLNKINASVYPNPFTQEATLRIDDIQNYAQLTLDIFDISGRRIRSTEITSNETIINRSALAAGVYVFTLKNNGETLATGRLVIQ